MKECPQKNEGFLESLKWRPNNHKNEYDFRVRPFVCTQNREYFTKPYFRDRVTEGRLLLPVVSTVECVLLNQRFFQSKPCQKAYLLSTLKKKAHSSLLFIYKI